MDYPLIPSHVTNGLCTNCLPTTKGRSFIFPDKSYAKNPVLMIRVPQKCNFIILSSANGTRFCLTLFMCLLHFIKEEAGMTVRVYSILLIMMEFWWMWFMQRSGTSLSSTTWSRVETNLHQRAASQQNEHDTSASTGMVYVDLGSLLLYSAHHSHCDPTLPTATMLIYLYQPQVTKQSGKRSPDGGHLVHSFRKRVIFISSWAFVSLLRSEPTPLIIFAEGFPPFGQVNACKQGDFWPCHGPR